MNVTRAGAIAAALGVGVGIAAGLGPSRVRAAAADTLAAAASSKGRYYGAALRMDNIDAEPDFRAALLSECGYVTPETALKWAAIEPSSGVLDFSAIDALVNFGTENGKPVRGHTLLWHRSVPDWAARSLREDRDWRLVARYFGSVMPRYGDAIHQWDVVNEPIDTGHRMDGLRENVFLQAFGPDYIPRALSQARLFAPRATLAINEYGLEYGLQVERDRRYLLLKLLDRLKNAGAPIDALGLQSHLDLRKGAVASAAIDSFLRSVTDLGIALVVTEFDVHEADYTASLERRDRLVADEARRYLDVVLAQKNVLGVVTWGLSDRHSWLEVTSEDYARFPGAWTSGGGPGLNRGLPLDASLRRKPLYFAIQDMLSSR